MKKFLKILQTLLLVAISFHVLPCSTFMLKNDSILIFGQNLDMPFNIPGYITKNNRGKVKTSITWEQIVHNGINSSPIEKWVSKFGSITFTPLGREFPEGGINEVGLYVREMSLYDTKFSESDIKPNMFMMQWIQYQLDNYRTVNEVIENINRIILDGWGWHFFIADSTGNSASIEFLNGEAVIYSGDNMPYKVITNSKYKSELDNISCYKGFGGDKKVDLENKSIDKRFIYAAHMIKEANKDSLKNPIQYGFSILKQALGHSGTQWSIIIDVKKSTIYFKTSVNSVIKKFNYSLFNYECDSPVLICNINLNDSGDISNRFINYTEEISMEYIKQGVEDIFGVNDAPNILKNVHRYSTYCFENED